MVTAGGPHYILWKECTSPAAHPAFDQRLAMTLGVALYNCDKVRPGGTLLVVGGTGGRRPEVGLAIRLEVLSFDCIRTILLGHLNPETTRGYAAVFPDHVIRAREQFIERRPTLRANIGEYREPTAE